MLTTILAYLLIGLSFATEGRTRKGQHAQSLERHQFDPSSTAEDDPGSLPRLMGLPVNLFNAGVFTLLSVLSFLLYYLGS